MPKTPKAACWAAAFNAKELEKDIDNPPAERFSEYLWRLGNLLPLPAGFNKSIQNKGIKHKIQNPEGKDYMSCGSISPKEIQMYLENDEVDVWFDSGQTRADGLVEALKAWSLNPEALWL